jgi:hypothetical protein
MGDQLPQLQLYLNIYSDNKIFYSKKGKEKFTGDFETSNREMKPNQGIMKMLNS